MPKHTRAKLREPGCSKKKKKKVIHVSILSANGGGRFIIFGGETISFQYFLAIYDMI